MVQDCHASRHQRGQQILTSALDLLTPCFNSARWSRESLRAAGFCCCRVLWKLCEKGVLNKNRDRKLALVSRLRSHFLLSTPFSQSFHKTRQQQNPAALK